MNENRANGIVVNMAPAVVGYVEAITATSILGWVWCPGRSDKITVELRHGNQTVSTAIADEMRDDLAKSGIGDGRHAFSLAIPEPWQQRSADLKVFAAPNGVAATALDAPSPINTVEDNHQIKMQRGLDMLVNSQRLIHRNLQAALLQKSPAVATSLTDIAATQAAIQDSISSIELFLVRLEQVSSISKLTAAPIAANRTLIVTIGASALAFAMSCLALGRVVWGA